MWYKIKTEASGWPSWCTNDEKKLKFLADFELKMGIKLDSSNMKKNPAMRYIAKIFLNSLWGKLAQRNNLSQTVLITEPEDYFRLLTDEKKELTSEVQVSDETLMATWKYRDDEDARANLTNIAVASFVTAYARLELLRHMRTIEAIRPGSLSYFDTDSVVYLRKLTDPEIPTGDYLGDLTDEAPGKRIIIFVSVGPKSYGYTYVDKDGNMRSVLKIKGMKLHLKALDVISIKKMIEIALKFSREGIEETVSVPQFEIRTNKHYMLYSRYFDKQFAPTSYKRVINCNTTLPYGY